jgi:thiol:disulfide interchange protein DsbD
MAGFFTVRLPQAVYMVNPSNSTLHGSFLFGVMTAILSTPCTAPFMGAAAAWAATQTPAIVLTVFFAIGLGMGLPYFILSAFPKLVDRMPRTGPASELIKQVMGLLMLAAAAYFIGVGLSGSLVHPPDPPSRLYLWLVAAFVAASGAWLLWRTFGITRSTTRRVVFGGLGAVCIMLAIAGGLRFTDLGPIKWIYYTPQRLAEAQANRKIVVMEFTAEWCLNCKALEEAVLRNDRVSSLLNSKDVAPIKVDITGNNTAGNAMLTNVQRRSIPLLVIFGPDGRELFKSDFYTIDQVVTAINTANGKQVAANLP